MGALVIGLPAISHVPGFSVVAVDDVTEAASRLRSIGFSAALVQVEEPASLAAEQLRTLLRVDPAVALVAVVPDGDVALGLACMHVGAADFLTTADLDPLPVAHALLFAIDRRRAGEAFTQTGESWDAGFRRAPLGMAVLSYDLRFLRVNDAFCEMTGRTEPDLLALVLADVIHPADTALAVARATEVLAGARDSDRLSTRLLGDNEPCFADLSLTVLSSIAGDPPRLLLQALDTSVSRRAASWGRALVEDAPHLVAVVSRSGTIRYVNRAVTTILGYQPDEILGTSFVARMHPDDRPAAWRSLHQGIAGGDLTRPLEIRAVDAGGSWRWLECFATNLLDDPAVDGMIVSARDVSDRRAAQQLVDDVTANSAEVVFLYDGDRQLRYVTPSIEPVLGYTPAEVLASMPDVAHPLDHARVVERFEALFTGQPVPGEVIRIRRKDGAVRWCMASGVPVIGRGGDVESVQIRAVDVTETYEARDRFELAFSAAPTGMALVDLDGQFLQVNRALCRITGRSEKELVGLTFRRITHPDDLVAELAHVERLLSGEGESYELEKRYFHVDGTPVWIHLSVSVARDAAGDPAYFIAHIQDITAVKFGDEARRRLAQQDTLTGLASRALFLEGIEERLANGNGIAVLSIDLDDLGIVNEALGRGTGDDVLRATALRLKELAGPGALVARLAGDEFAVAVTAGGPSDAIALAELVVEGIPMPIVTGRGEVAVSASVGATYGKGRRNGAEVLLREADAAMLTAKNRGRSRAELYRRKRRMARTAIGRSALADAIAQDQIEVAYQPAIDLVSGRMMAAEALARWHHPSRGVVPPAEFIPMAEESGLIGRLGDLVLDQACRDAVGWHRQHPEVEAPSVWVNLSPLQLADYRIVGRVAQILATTALEPRLLHLEITESVLMDEAGAAHAILSELRRIGVCIAIDDFGTGYSSLGRLKLLPVDVLKVDRSFVDGVVEQPEDRAIVSAVIGLARMLGLTAVAEGVERADQAEVIADLGCDMAQGYYWSRPVDAKALSDFLAGHGRRITH